MAANRAACANITEQQPVQNSALARALCGPWRTIFVGMKVHFIAIGGAAMHNLALALHHKGYHVTGSDDAVFDPSKSRLEKYGLLPAEFGWFPEKITAELDAVILGMHARQDNPELARAKELGLQVFSYPEYLYEQSRDKTRVVIGGSHGKTSITAMILHVLNHAGLAFDYMVGAQLDGFETMVQLSDAPIIVLEGDEYLSSPIDRRPKFHLYKPNIALLSGIAWDHINVFPTFDNYVEQFRIFVDMIEAGGSIAYCVADSEVQQVVEQSTNAIDKMPYQTPAHEIVDGTTYLLTDAGKVPLQVFGNHNLQNLEGARLVCGKLGVRTEVFYEAIQSFGGAARRLELVKKSGAAAVYKDFAHSPSKLKATTAAVQAQYPNRTLVACMELHTFSSLSAAFLQQYKGSMDTADVAIVYFNPETIAHKKLPPITVEQVKEGFARADLQVFTSSAQLVAELEKMDWQQRNLLLMTSGNFDGVDAAELADRLL